MNKISKNPIARLIDSHRREANTDDIFPNLSLLDNRVSSDPMPNNRINQQQEAIVVNQIISNNFFDYDNSPSDETKSQDRPDFFEPGRTIRMQNASQISNQLNNQRTPN